MATAQIAARNARQNADWEQQQARQPQPEPTAHDREVTLVVHAMGVAGIKSWTGLARKLGISSRPLHFWSNGAYLGRKSVKKAGAQAVEWAA